MSENRRPAVGSGGPSGQGAAANRPYCYSTPKPSGGQFIFLGGRRVASVDADHTLRRTLHSERHLYTGKGEESWSFHAPVITEAERIGACQIEVRDADSGATYRVEMATFRRQAVPFVNAWGAQLALALRYWSVTTEAAMEMQPALF